MPTEARINITAKDRTKGALGSVQRGMKSLKSSVLSVTGIMAGLAGAAGMGALVRSSLKTGDALGKTADKLGLTTEALAGMRLAAERTAGVTGKTLDTALQRMVRRTSEASQGLGSAKGALEELNLEAASLSQLSADEQFKAIANAMEDVTNQGDRVRLSMQLFDTEGVALEKVMKGGAATLEEYAKQADAFGLAISRVDAARMEAANDAIDNIGSAVNGAANAITIGLAGALQLMAEAMTENSKATSDWAANTERAVKFVLGLFEWVGKGLDGLKGLFNLFAMGVNNAWALIYDGIGRVLERMAALAEYIPGAWGDSIQAGLTTASEAALLFSDVATVGAEGYSAALVQNIEDIESWQGMLTGAYDTAKTAAENSVKGQVVALKSLSQATKVQIEENSKWLDAAVKAQEKGDQKKAWSQQQYVGAATSAGDALFQNNKAVKSGLVVVDTASSIMNAMSSLPWPANLAAAASAAAMGAAQLAAVRSASKGGGSTPSAGGGGATGTAPTFGLSSDDGGGSPQQPTLNDAPTGGGSTTTANISLQSGLYSKEDIRGLIEQINEEVGDGATLEVAA